MGDVMSCNKSEHDYMRQYVSAMQKKKYEVLQPTEHSLSAKITKETSKYILVQYEDKGRIKDYIKSIKNTIKDYSEFKFASFLSNLFYLNVAEKLNSNPPKLVEDKRASMSGIEYYYRARIGLSESSSPDKLGLEDDYNILAKGTFQDKVFNFMTIELMKRDSFFFEMVKAFAEEFQCKFLNATEKYAKILYDCSNNFDQDSFQNPVANNVEFDNLYKKAIKDVKDFQNFLCDCLLAFVKQISRSILNSEDLIPTKDKRLEKLATRILFTKNNIYEIIFKLIRLKHIEVELKLKKCFVVLKDNTLPDFKVGTSFCLTEEESPYQVAIDCINYIDTFTNPYDKYENIFRMRKEIYQSVDQYWANRPLSEGKNKLLLTADQMVPIYCYCLANCCNVRIKANQIFIQEFIHEHLLKYGEEAYYFTTFTASIDFLIMQAEKAPVVN